MISRRSVWLAVALAGCSALGTVQPSGMPVREAYHHGSSRGDRLQISDTTSPLTAKQPVPVLSQPQVLAVYAPSRLDRKRDVLVGEHWIFLKLQDAEWFTEAKGPLEPPTRGTVPESEFEPLRVLPWDRAVRGE